jgi:hypothetical protein
LRNSVKAIPRRRFLYAGLAASVLLVVAFDCNAADLDQKTVAAFDYYVRVAVQQMQSSLRSDGPFLWIDARPASTRRRLYAQLRSGQFVIRQLDTYDDGREIDIPNGMVHHWIGLAFVPGATLQSAEAVLDDYQDYQRIYAPKIRRSKVLSRDGRDLELYLQLYADSPRRVAFNADFHVHRMNFGPARIASASISTRIAQLQDPSRPNGPELPVGHDSGYLWRMNNYWRCEQKDGGVYLQVESISLSRDVPMLLSWFVKPIIHRVARETLAGLLDANRRAIHDPAKFAPHAFAASPSSPPAPASPPPSAR